ncbi:MAG: elongation factor G [Bdellovibrionales bacterium]|nr:elongation factor G [Bdellovibrionales bacterium]
MANQWVLEKVRNIGISAHIDSGKTTLTERILFYTGRIHAIHEVKGKDGVGATMDHMELERERGITIQSAATNVNWKDIEINIIDTPGHVDFTIEVERSLRVLDGAILVLCGVAGVQSQSITVDRQMRRYKVPRLAFINKLDRAGANPVRVLNALREKLRHNAALMEIPIGAEDKFEGVVDLVKMRAFYFHGPNGEKIEEKEIPANLMEDAKKWRHELIGKAADFDDALAEKFLMEEEPTEVELKAAIRKGCLKLDLTPVFIGSAYKNKGVQLLLDGVRDYLPNPSEVKNEALNLDENEAPVELSSEPTKPLVALAFKLEDGRYGQLTFMRIYQGTMKKGEFITNLSGQGRKVKVPRIVHMHADEMEECEEAKAGDIVAVFGIDCSSGDTFTDGKVNWAMTSMFVPDSVISLAIRPKDKTADANFSKALQKFRKEDPTFRVHRAEESNETIIQGMGELHLEIYMERMKREFNCEVVAGAPQVAFRETISQACAFDYTHKKQTGGAGQYAKVVGELQPLDSIDKTYDFENKVVGGKIPREFIPAVDRGFQEQMAKGPLIGFPVVGVKVVLTDGAYHDVDSSEMAFRICAQTAFREFYFNAKPVALEPVMKLETSAPEEFQGNVMGQINQRRGIIQGTNTNEGFVTIEAEVPLAEMFGYSTDLRSATQGKGEFTMEFSRYAQVPRNIQDDLVKKYQQKRAEEQKK